MVAGLTMRTLSLFRSPKNRSTRGAGAAIYTLWLEEQPNGQRPGGQLNFGIAFLEEA